MMRRSFSQTEGTKVVMFLQTLIWIDIVALQVIHKVEELYDDIVRHVGKGVVIFALTVGDVVEAKLRFCCAEPS